MYEWLVHPFTGLTARVIIGVVFALSGLAKIGHLPDFVEEVREYEVLPGILVEPFALLLPWVELAVAFGLALGLFSKAASGTAALLLLVFSAAMVVNLRRGRAIYCHCFGQLVKEKISWGSVVRNFGLLFLALTLISQPSYPFSLDDLALQTNTPRLSLMTPQDLIPWFLISLFLMALYVLTRQAVILWVDLRQS